MKNRAWILGKSLANKIRTDGTRIRQPFRLILQCFCAIFDSMIKVSQSYNSLQNNLMFPKRFSVTICSLSKAVDFNPEKQFSVNIGGNMCAKYSHVQIYGISLLLN